MTTWVIQSNMLDPIQIGQILDALSELNIPYTGVQILPFIEEIKFLTEEPTETKVIPYGSTKLHRLSQERNWSGLFFDKNTFRIDTWIRNRSDMLNQNPAILTIEQIAPIFNRLPEDEPWFIRPLEDLKAFNGMVTSAKEIARFTTSKEAGNFSFSGDLLVALSAPVNIKAEWRWFIVEGKIVSGSMYRLRGQRLVQREQDQKVIAEAQQLADVWLPHETCVMDTALVEDGIKVVEFNTFNSAGFYYHDIKAVVKAVTEYVEKRG